MASLKEIKTRIGSVKNTLKITSSMKLVASAKLHRAQMAIEGMLPYSQRLEQMVSNLVASMSGEEGLSSPLAEVRPIRRVAIVCVSSSTSLCGGFNNNLIRFTQQVIDEYNHLGKNAITLVPIGRKVAQAFASTTELNLVNDFLLIGEKPAYNETSMLASMLTDMYLRGEIDRVEILYTHYKNMAVQTLTRKQFLPIEATKSDLQGEESTGTLSTDYIIEPSATELLATLLPQALAMRLYAILLDSAAAEHAARTFAMQTATDNGEELLHELNLQYNKVRQQAITNELLDIVGGQMR